MKLTRGKIICLLIFVSSTLLLTSCEGMFDSCMVCQLNQYEGDILMLEGAETEYCGAELAVIRAKQDVIDGIYTYKWECR